MKADRQFFENRERITCLSLNMGEKIYELSKPHHDFGIRLREGAV